MTPLIVGLICFLSGVALAGTLVLVLHQGWEAKRQREHEAKAQERYATLVKALNDARALTLSAVSQRNRLENRTDWLEEAIVNHAGHLEALGRTEVHKFPPPEKP